MASQPASPSEHWFVEAQHGRTLEFDVILEVIICEVWKLLNVQVKSQDLSKNSTLRTKFPQRLGPDLANVLAAWQEVVSCILDLVCIRHSSIAVYSWHMQAAWQRGLPHSHAGSSPARQRWCLLAERASSRTRATERAAGGCKEGEGCLAGKGTVASLPQTSLHV